MNLQINAKTMSYQTISSRTIKHTVWGYLSYGVEIDCVLSRQNVFAFLSVPCRPDLPCRAVKWPG